MSNMPWFRVYSEILDDRKLKRICKKTGNSKALVIGVWVCLLSLANRSPERGVLIMSEDMPYSLDDLEDETEVPREMLAQLIDEFKTMDMMTGNTTWIITNWSKRQFKSDSSAERVREFRAKRYSNKLDTESESDTESETELKEKEEKAAKIFKFYEANFGSVTAYLRDEIGDAIDTYPFEWIMDAMQRAVIRKALNWAYVLTILKDWKANGFQNKDSQKNGNGKPQHQDEGIINVTQQRLAKAGK